MPTLENNDLYQNILVLTQKLTLPEKLQLLNNLAKEIEKDVNSLAGQFKEKNWSEYMDGLHKDVWEGVDVQGYLREERESWE